MARIAGVEVPKNKRSIIALTYLYGVGKTSSAAILDQAKVSHDKRVTDLSPEEISQITRVINDDYKIEGDLRSEKRLNIKRLIEIACYRGKRHREGRKLRGQKTRNSGRMVKSKHRPIANKKKAGK